MVFQVTGLIFFLASFIYILVANELPSNWLSLPVRTPFSLFTTQSYKNAVKLIPLNDYHRQGNEIRGRLYPRTSKMLKLAKGVTSLEICLHENEIH
jgi:hypothetical protein